MQTVVEQLREADPAAAEIDEAAAHRERMRRVVIDAAGHQSSVRPALLARRRFGFAVATGAIALLGWGAWSRLAVPVQAAVRFELRLAEEQPSPGLFQARVVDEDRVVYLHNEVAATNGDIASSSARAIPSGYVIDVAFTDAGAEKIRQATSSHLGRPIAILIDGEVVMAPSIRSPIGRSAVITGTFGADAAERIAQGLTIQP